MRYDSDLHTGNIVKECGFSNIRTSQQSNSTAVFAGSPCRNEAFRLDKIPVIIHLADISDLVIKSKANISHNSLLPVDHDLLIS